MPHIHELIDFTVGVFVVYKNKVLLVHHKGLSQWLPVGGHIELDEDPEHAALRETKEESGLDIELYGERPIIPNAGTTRLLIAPMYVDIHEITDTHRHIGLAYFATATTDTVKLAEAEHHDIRWFTQTELSSSQYAIQTVIQFYATQALQKLGTTSHPN